MPPYFSKIINAYIALIAGAVTATYAGTRAYKSHIQQNYDDRIDVTNQSVEIDPIEHIRCCTYYKDIDIYSHY